MPESLTLGLTGDVMFGRKVDEYQRGRQPMAVWGDLAERLRTLDGLCINLECCLSTRGSRWTRTHRPFHFRADPEWAIPALEGVGVDCCSLANNHLLDFGPVALGDTIDALDAAGIAHAGAGEDLDTALEPAQFSVDGLDVAVVAFTDNTPEYAADPDSPGVARIEMDVDEERTGSLVDEALDRATAADPDLLVASLHWGPNMVTVPPAAFERFGHWLVDRGVDLIHGHSAHVFQAVEVYDGAPILYDTGDFVDDYRVDPDLRNDRSFLFEVEIGEDGSLESLGLEPTQIEDCAVRTADSPAAEWARDRMRELSAPYGTAFESDGSAMRLDL